MKAIISAAVAILVLVAVLVPLAMSETTVVLEQTQHSQPTGMDAISAFATQDIPPRFLRAYLHATQTVRGVPWEIIAGIGKVECDHGRTTVPPGCQPSQRNSAGAEGPMQFLPATWQAYGRDCDGDGVADVYKIEDAACGTAQLLSANLVGGISQAVFAYNHDWGYVSAVLAWAAKYVVGGVVGVADAIGKALGGAVTKVLSVGDALRPLFPWVPASGFPDPFPAGQCTWYAAWEHSNTFSTGNAEQWFPDAVAHGVRTARTPSVGAIAVWGASKSYSVYGHVGIVTQVQRTGFVVSEMNYSAWNVIDTRWVPNGDPALEGFVP